MESEDYEFFKGLDLLTFSTEIQEFGVSEVRALIPDGRNVIVSWRSFIKNLSLHCLFVGDRPLN